MPDNSLAVKLPSPKDRFKGSDKDFHPKYICKTVSKPFRTWLLNRFGFQKNTKGNDPAWKFLYYVLFGDNHDKTSGELLIPFKLLAEMEGKKADGNYKGIDFLTKMKSHFPELNLSWRNWKAITHQSRTLTFTLPDDVKQALDKELLVFLPDQVFFLDGTKPQVQVEREKALKKVDEISRKITKTKHITDNEKLILGYMNGLSPNQFSKIRKRISKAVKIAEGYEDQIRKHQLCALKDIDTLPQPFYHYSPRTTRITTLGQSLANVKRDLRKTLTVEWTEADLKCAGLSINAKIWNLPKLQNFIETGGNWWAEISNHLGIPLNKANKDLLKTATYALSYGAGRNTIKNGDTDKNEEGLGDLTDKFFEHELVQEISEGGKKQLKEIGENKGAYDAYGNWIDVTQDLDQLSILSLVNHSYEQIIISEVFELASNTSEFQIVLYQYDGITIVFRDKRRKDLWINKINDSVSKKAQELGISTYVEFETLH